MMQKTEQFTDRQRSAANLATAHATWYEEFGHKYLFMFSNLTKLPVEQATAVATFILLNDMAAKLELANHKIQELIDDQAYARNAEATDRSGRSL